LNIELPTICLGSLHSIAVVDILRATINGIEYLGVKNSS